MASLAWVVPLSRLSPQAREVTAAHLSARKAPAAISSVRAMSASL
jgi:hypothetical protein